MSTAPYNGYSWKIRELILKDLNRKKLKEGFRLEPRPCDMCGDPNRDPESWHSEDYSQPYRFEPPATYWLCRTCHLRIHKRFGEPPENWWLYMAHIRCGGYGSEFTKSYTLAVRRQLIAKMQAGESVTLPLIRERHIEESPWWEQLTLDRESLTAAWARPRPLRPRPTRDEYLQALSAVGVSDAELALLNAHAQSINRSVTLGELAATCMPGHSANEVEAIYSGLAQRICAATKWEPDQPKGREPIWIGILAESWLPEGADAVEKWAMIRDLTYALSDYARMRSIRADRRELDKGRKEVEGTMHERADHKSKIDPALFEYTPQDPEQEVEFADYKAAGLTPDYFTHEDDRAAYAEYLERTRAS